MQNMSNIYLEPENRARQSMGNARNRAPVPVDNRGGYDRRHSIDESPEVPLAHIRSSGTKNRRPSFIAPAQTTPPPTLKTETLEEHVYDVAPLDPPVRGNLGRGDLGRGDLGRGAIASDDFNDREEELRAEMELFSAKAKQAELNLKIMANNRKRKM